MREGNVHASETDTIHDEAIVAGFTINSGIPVEDMARVEHVLNRSGVVGATAIIEAPSPLRASLAREVETPSTTCQENELRTSTTLRYCTILWIHHKSAAENKKNNMKIYRMRL